ncbi:MAG TPA: hypothetical protein VEX15_08950 [Nocardioidaceae bacterium]|nr:hypothetical protein [Nocardioidaceae bacterium]
MNRVIKALVASGVTAALVATMAACDPDSDSTSGSSEGSTTPTADPAASESVQPIYAYVAHNEIFVMDGDHQIGHVDGDDPFPSLAWSDDARYLAVLQGGVLTVLDVESGQTSELDCTSCGAMTIWGDRLVVSEPAAGAGFAYDLVTYALPDLSGRQLLRADFPRPVGYWWKVSVAGDDLVAFGAEENGGARSSLDIYLVHPDGSTARVGKREYAGPAGFAYAADSAYGGPRFAYVSQTSGGVCTGESRALLVDPASPEGATETDATDVFHHPLISEAMDEFIDVWFGTDGMLYATAHTRSCEFSAGGYAKDLAPPGVWRLDGTQWVSVDDRPLLSERVFGPDERVEITMNPDAPGPNGELWGTLRWITADGATVLSRGASQISTPPYAADEPDAPVEEPDREELAERFAPMIWIAKGEELQPIDADRIIAESDLMFSNPGPGGCPDPIVSDESVDAQRLAAGGYVAYEQVNGCQDGKRWVTNEGPAPMDRDQAGFYLDIRDAAFGGDGNTAPVYVEFKDGQYLVYWFAYGDNNATLGPVKDFDHEGDWERMGVRLDANNEPTDTVYWTHGAPCSVPWPAAPKDGEHPIGFAAKGTHATYPEAGRFRYEFVDRTSAGTRWETWTGAEFADEQPWWSYTGAWGTVGQGKHSTGPDGPSPDGNNLAAALDAQPCKEFGSDVPEAFYGHWRSQGPVDQPGSTTDYYAELTVYGGESSEQVGQSYYPGLECRGALTLKDADDDKLVLIEQIQSDPRDTCADKVTITLRPDEDGLAYTGTSGLIHKTSARAVLEPR